MMFFLIMSFIVFVPAEGKVPLNRTENLIPMNSDNVWKEESLVKRVENDELVKNKSEEEFSDSAKIDEKKNINSSLELGSLKLPGEQVKIGGLKPTQLQSFAEHKWSMESDTPQGSGERNKSFEPTGGRGEIDERKYFRENGRIRRQRFGGTGLFANNTPFVRRRPYRGPKEFREKNGVIDVGGGPVRLQGQYGPQEMVYNISSVSSSPNHSDVLDNDREESLSGKPVAIGRLRPQNGPIRSGLGRERIYRNSHQFDEQNPIRTLGEVNEEGENGTGKHINSNGRNIDELVQMDRLKHPEEAAHPSQQNRPENKVRSRRLNSTSKPLPVRENEDGVSASVSRLHGKPVQSNKENRPGEVKPSTESLSFSEQKRPRGHIETDATELHGKSLLSNAQASISQLFKFGGLAPILDTLRNNIQRAGNGILGRPGKPEQFDSQKRFDESANSSEPKSTGGIYRVQKNYEKRVKNDKPLESKIQKRPSDLATFGGQKHPGERVEIERPEPRSKKMSSKAEKLSGGLLTLLGKTLLRKQLDNAGSFIEHLVSKPRNPHGKPQHQSDHFNETDKMGKRNILSLERMMKGPNQVARQNGSRRQFYLNNENRSGGPARDRSPYRPYEKVIMRNRKLNRLGGNKSLEDEIFTDDQFPRNRLFEDEEEDFHMKNINGPHQFREKIPDFNEVNQNPSTIRKIYDRRRVFGDGDHYHVNKQKVNIRKFNEHHQLDKNIKHDEEKKTKKRVVLIIPVPKGKGQSMKEYEGIMKFLRELFPNVFPP